MEHVSSSLENLSVKTKIWALGKTAPQLSPEILQSFEVGAKIGATLRKNLSAERQAPEQRRRRSSPYGLSRSEGPYVSVGPFDGQLVEPLAVVDEAVAALAADQLRAQHPPGKAQSHHALHRRRPVRHRKQT